MTIALWLLVVLGFVILWLLYRILGELNSLDERIWRRLHTELESRQMVQPDRVYRACDDVSKIWARIDLLSAKILRVIQPGFSVDISGDKVKVSKEPSYWYLNVKLVEDKLTKLR